MGKVQRIANRHNEEAEPLDEEDELEDDDAEEQVEEEEEQGPPETGRREAKYRKRAKEAERQLQAVTAELNALKAEQDGGSSLVALRAELAFVKEAARSGVSDPEAAWKLADQTSVLDSYDEETGEFSLDEVLENVVGRYPYLAKNDDDEGEPPARVQAPPSGAFEAHTSPTSGKPTNGPKKGHQGIDRSFLEKKYPSLRTRRRSL